MGVDRMPRAMQKQTLEETVQKLLLSSSKKKFSTRICGSVFEAELSRLKRMKFNLELIKGIDCFLEGHGGYTSSLLFSEKNFCEITLSETLRGLF